MHKIVSKKDGKDENNRQMAKKYSEQLQLSTQLM